MDDWRKWALCTLLELPVSAFYPNERSDLEAIKAVCQECEVRQACLDYAIPNESEGIWGGLTESERTKYATSRYLQVKPRASEQQNIQHEQSHPVYAFHLSPLYTSDSPSHNQPALSTAVEEQKVSAPISPVVQRLQLLLGPPYRPNRNYHDVRSLVVPRMLRKLHGQLRELSHENLGPVDPLILEQLQEKVSSLQDALRQDP